MNTNRTRFLAVALAALSTSGLAQAGEILLYSDSQNYPAVYGYRANGSGNFTAGTSSRIDYTFNNNRAYLADQQVGVTVPYYWALDSSGGARSYTSDGTAVYSQGAVVLNYDQQAVVDSAGNLYAHQYNTGKLYRITGVTAANVVVNQGSSGVAIDANGIVYAQLWDGSIEKYSASGADLGQFAAAQSNGQATVLNFDSQGNLYGLVNNGRSLEKFNSSGVFQGLVTTAIPWTSWAGGNTPLNNFTIDSHDNIWVAQAFGSNGVGSISRISAGGTVTTFDTVTQLRSVAALNFNDTPEPATGFVMATGIAGLLWVRRMRRN